LNPEQLTLIHYNEFEDDEEVEKRKQKMESQSKSIWDYQFVIELIILALCPIPYYDQYVIYKTGGKDTIYFLSEFLMSFMWLRIFQICRTALNYGEYGDAFSKRVSWAYGFEPDFKYTLLCFYKLNQGTFVFILYLGTVFIFAYMVRIFEIPFFRADGSDTFDSYFTSIWFTVISLTTIGYGDISPGTVPGQFLTIILASWGVLLLSFMVVATDDAFSIKETSKKVAQAHVQTHKAAA